MDQPDPTDKSRYQYYKRAMRTAKEDGPYVIPFAQSFFESAWQPFGFETFTKLLFKRPDFIKDIIILVLSPFLLLAHILPPIPSIIFFDKVLEKNDNTNIGKLFV